MTETPTGGSRVDMALYDEKKAVADIRALPDGVRFHLSHVVRNGMCSVLAAHKTGKTGTEVERALFDFESRFRELGL